ncbi:MAG TPA: ERAP1-like C-terminal domain-containing protein, partial [Thermoplasmata archaeon]|nr:ERAP1-like C-terminal domain-containing protein [Thermoplasmata archaeon]
DGHHTPEHWPIPLGISRGETIERRLFDAPQDSLPLPGNRWVHLNPGALGFYRVHYDDELYRRLREAFPGLPSADRWSILQDLFSFLLSGDASRDLYYGFLDASRQANEHLIVHEIANQLSSTIPGRHPTALGALLGDEPDFRRHALLWLSSEMARLGLAERAGEPEVAAVLRGRVASSLAPLDRDFARGLARRYAEYRSVAPDLRWPVLFSYASLGGASEHDELLRALRAAPDEGDALRLERSLARFPDPALVARTLDLALAPPFNRAHLQAVVREAALNPAGRTAVWEWIRSTMHTVEPEYKGTSVIADILKFALPYAALGRRSEAEAELSERPFAEGKRGALEGLAMLGIYERFLAGGG